MTDPDVGLTLEDGFEVNLDSNDPSATIVDATASGDTLVIDFDGPVTADTLTYRAQSRWEHGNTHYRVRSAAGLGLMQFWDYPVRDTCEPESTPTP
jgi:hypothetical protein